MILKGENQRARREISPIASFPTTDRMQADEGPLLHHL